MMGVASMRHHAYMDSGPESPTRQAAAAMLDRLDELVDAVTEGVWAGVPGYSSVLLGRGDLRGYVRGNLITVFTSLHDDVQVDDADTGNASTLGENRALQGVPVEALIRSFRAAERAVVEQFTRFYSLFATDLAGQQRGVATILAGLDRVESAALEAYRETHNRLIFDDGQASADLVGKLASGEKVSPDDLKRIAQHLNVEPAQSHIAVAVRLVSAADRSATGQVRSHVTARLLEVAQRPVLTGAVHETMLFVVPVAIASAPLIRRALGRALAPSQCRYDLLAGVGPPVDDLFAAGASCRAAMEAMESAARTGRIREPVDYDDALVDILLSANTTVADRLVQLALSRVEGQDRLTATLRAFFACGQSTAETAQVLVVHQNTVVYRLRRIKELTGLDVRRTDDLVILWLAVRALDLRSGELHIGDHRSGDADH